MGHKEGSGSAVLGWGMKREFRHLTDENRGSAVCDADPLRIFLFVLVTGSTSLNVFQLSFVLFVAVFFCYTVSFPF